MAFKQAEDEKGFVFRVCDFGGTGGPVALSLPKAVAAVSSCDLVEANEKKEPAQGKTVAVPVKAFAPATIKVRFAQ
jgi:alpha-mannosidase